MATPVATDHANSFQAVAMRVTSLNANSTVFTGSGGPVSGTSSRPTKRLRRAMKTGGTARRGNTEADSSADYGRAIGREPKRGIPSGSRRVVRA